MPYAVCSRIQLNEITCNWGAKNRPGLHTTVFVVSADESVAAGSLLPLNCRRETSCQLVSNWSVSSVRHATPVAAAPYVCSVAAVPLTPGLPYISESEYNI